MLKEHNEQEIEKNESDKVVICKYTSQKHYFYVTDILLNKVPDITVTLKFRGVFPLKFSSQTMECF